MEITLNSGAAAAGGSAQNLIKDSDTQNFAADVIEPSAQVPVIVDFWAPWCEPCKQLGPMLEKAVTEAGGIVRMVKINVDDNQELAQQLRIQSIPAVYVFRDGKPVDGFTGAVPASQIKALIDRVTGDAKSPVDEVLEHAKAALDGGDVETAKAAYAQVLQHAGDNKPALAGILRCALAEDDLEGARQIADGLNDEFRADSDIAAAITALELAEQSGNADSGQIAGLQEKLAQNENDHQTRLDLGMALYGAGQTEAALDELLELIRRDRAWNDEAGRKQMVKIFEALGPTDPLVATARRQLSSILFS